MNKIAEFLYIVTMVVLIIGLCLISPACWHYAINAWLLWAHKPTTFGWGPSIICGLLLAPFSVPLAAITYIAMLFL